MPKNNYPQTYPRVEDKLVNTNYGWDSEMDGARKVAS
jgi:hypothetical protein